MNQKRVYRLLREDKPAVCPQAQVRRDHRPNHGCKIHPNLAAGMVPTGVDQLWRADITDVRLRGEFVFLAVILDAA